MSILVANRIYTGKLVNSLRDFSTRNLGKLPKLEIKILAMRFLITPLILQTGMVQKVRKRTFLRLLLLNRQACGPDCGLEVEDFLHPLDWIDVPYCELVPGVINFGFSSSLMLYDLETSFKISLFVILFWIISFSTFHDLKTYTRLS